MQDSIEYKNLLQKAFATYLEKYGSTELKPTDDYLLFEFDFLNDKKWFLFGKEIVHGELNEVTNILNHWQGLLRQWHNWNLVIASYNENDAWYLRTEFLESTVFQCLYQPSAIRDKFTFIATNAVHQIRLGNESNYSDTLAGDPKLPNLKQTYLSRRQKEVNLSKLTEGQAEACDDFIKLRNHLDDENYKTTTIDYRNSSSHAISPRLGIGETGIYSRTVGQRIELKKQSCGGFLECKVDGEIQVSYGVGGISPLDMEITRIANFAQYQCARNCYQAYLKLLNSMLETENKS